MTKNASKETTEKANTRIKRNLRNNLSLEGLTEVVCHLDPDTLELLNKYCLDLGFGDPSGHRARKAKTYSLAITRLILKSCSAKPELAPATRKALELHRLRAIVKQITEHGGMTAIDAATHMTDRGYYPPRFVIFNAKPTRSQRVWTESDIENLMNLKMVKSRIKKLNQQASET